jgi:hypothetical protein
MAGAKMAMIEYPAARTNKTKRITVLTLTMSTSSEFQIPIVKV